MSINANYTGNIQAPVHAVLTTSSATAIGSAATDNTQIVAGFSFVNPTGGAVTCNMYWNDGTSDNLVWSKSVAAGSTETESNIPIHLFSGHSIKALGANTVTVTLIYTAAYQTA